MPTVIITGSGSGLGRELALAWSKKGWRVVVTDMDLASAEETAQMLASPENSLSARLDVTRDDDFKDLVGRLQAEKERIDVLVNNAGIASAGRLSATPLEHWNRLLDVNLMGVVRGCRAFETMLADGGGHIVNIASFAGIANAPAMGTYNVAKAGVISLSETLRTELDSRGIGVTVVCPSFFKTPLLERAEAFGLDLKTIGNKLMDASPIDASFVASYILAAVDRGDFMCIPHRDARWLYRLKRWAPNTFSRMMISRARGLLRQAE